MLQVVWFKRDLRWEDHAPLTAAVATGQPVVAILLHEPSIWSQDVYANRHARFVYESANELMKTSPVLGITESKSPPSKSFSNETNRIFEPNKIPFFYIQSEAVEAFEALHTFSELPIGAIYSHEEIGIEATWARDRKMKEWFQKHQIQWKETPYGSVRRGLKRRDDWIGHWNEAMYKEPLSQTNFPQGRAWSPSIDWIKWSENHAVRQPKREAEIAQTGGPTWAHKYLNSFASGGRGRGYMANISKPDRARTHCSRLSPYLAWGNISLKQVVQSLSQTNQGTLLTLRDSRAFASRLRWREHFIQKFESEPRMEFEHLNRGYQSQIFSANSAHLNAWKLGQTGVPMVDACMRSLKATGYLNFRMRAMLVSYGCHALNLHWKDLSSHLAQQFLDFEPGIHYPQLQMQAAVTGINTVRIYNPVKQAEEHDPDGEFISKWVPELSCIPMPFRAAPWKLTPIDCAAFNFNPGIDYPCPLVDLTDALREARIRLYGAKKKPEVQVEKARILAMHITSKRSRKR